jgi:uncharacterized protein
VQREERKFRSIAKWTITAICAITILCGYLISKIEFDYNFENFFPQDDPETEFYQSFRHHFETDNDFVIVGLVNQEGIFMQPFLERVDSLSAIFAQVKHIEEVLSPTLMKDVIIDPTGTPRGTKNLIRVDQPEYYSADSAKIYQREELIGTAFSADGKSLVIQLKHKEFLSKSACDSLSYELQDILTKFTFDESHIVGRSIGQTYYVSMMQREVVMFIFLSLVLIILFLFIAFRSAWGIWVPLTVVMLSVIWILGLMQLTGKAIDIMLIILPTIIFVVGMSDVVHVLSRYFEELRAGQSKLQALKISFKEIGMATFLTSLTTAIGFLTLVPSSIKPISDFGLYTSIGVFVAFILAFSLLPSVLVLSKTPKIVTYKDGKVFWTKQMHLLFGWTLRNRKSILIGSALVGALAIFGATKVELNNYLLEDLRETDPLKQEFLFFEEHFAGGRPFELALMLDDTTNVYDRSVLMDISRIDSFLVHSYEVGNLISPAQIIKTANRTLKGGQVRFAVIPDSQREINKLVRTIERSEGNEFLSLFVNEEKHVARINGKVADAGAKAFQSKNVALDKFLAELSPHGLQVKVTGTANLIDLNNESLARDMTYGLFFAFLVVACVVGIMFKSWKMTIVCLIPNFFPLLLILGIMGFAGIDLKVSTSIIFTIAFGIAVDDTIHFMSKLRLQLAKGRSMLYAVKRTFISTGKAIVVTSIILCGGFLTLVLSNFLGTFYIGLLISLTLLFAVLADLLLLPVLIIYLFPKEINVLGTTAAKSHSSNSKSESDLIA